MPWQASDALRHSSRATTAKKRKMWSEVANAVLKQTGDEGRAVRAANAAIKKHGMGKKKA